MTSNEKNTERENPWRRSMKLTVEKYSTAGANGARQPRREKLTSYCRVHPASTKCAAGLDGRSRKCLTARTKVPHPIRSQAVQHMCPPRCERLSVTLRYRLIPFWVWHRVTHALVPAS